MAEIAGVDPRSIKAWSLRSTRLREWAQQSRGHQWRTHRCAIVRRAKGDASRQTRIAVMGSPQGAVARPLGSLLPESS